MSMFSVTQFLISFSFFLDFYSTLPLPTFPLYDDYESAAQQETIERDIWVALQAGLKTKPSPMHCGNGIENTFINQPETLTSHTNKPDNSELSRQPIITQPDNIVAVASSQPISDEEILTDQSLQSTEMTREKRGILVPVARKFEKTRISWFIRSQSFHINSTITENIMTEAFKIWESVSPLSFYQDPVNPDIIIRFGNRLHGDCPVPFDDEGSQLGHSWTMGEVHINDAVSLLHPEMLKHIAVHELGHALGLEHIEWNPQAVMFSVYYNPTDETGEIVLTDDDIHAIQNLYGKCERRSVAAMVDFRVDRSFGTRYLLTEDAQLWSSTTSGSVRRIVTPSLSNDERVKVVAVLQMGRREDYRSYIITSDNQVVLVDTSSWELVTEDDEGLQYPQKLVDMWPCFDSNSNNDVQLQTAYYNRRDRTVYLYTKDDENYWVYRYNAKQGKCLDRIQFSELHQPGNDRSTTKAWRKATTTENPPLLQIGESNLVKSDTAPPVVAPQLHKIAGNTAGYTLHPSNVTLVYQQHESQETYIVTVTDEIWRVRKQDYTLQLVARELPGSWQVSQCIQSKPTVGGPAFVPAQNASVDTPV